MSIKIFLPTDYFYMKRITNLYGQVQISEDNVVAYYVIDESSDLKYQTTCKLRYLGSIINSIAKPNRYQQDMVICFAYNDVSPSISLTHIGITPESLKQIKILLYDKSIVRNMLIKKSIHEDINLHNQCDFHTLFELIQSDKDFESAANAATRTSCQLLYLFANIPSQMFNYIVEKPLINQIMMHTVIYKHYKEWQATYTNVSRLSNIVLDRVLGIMLMLVLFMLISHPGDFLMQIFHGIINKLYSLLRVLEGSPVGLKLNIHLNNFFLDCFKYHIELWSTFLDLIEPAVRQLFLAIGVLGCMGFSYQIALLADLLSIVGLHAHCFYVYTKVLYNVEIKGLRVLWQVVRGKRFNILKGRIETHNYMNRQLYLATIFFSAILFLFPTTLVYYIVFATLKSFTFSTIIILDFFRRQLINFPIEQSLKWLNRSLIEIECLKVRDLPLLEHRFLKHANCDIRVFVFGIEL